MQARAFAIGVLHGLLLAVIWIGCAIYGFLR